VASTRTQSRQRKIALAIGTLAAASLALVVWRARPKPAAITLVDNSLGLQAEWTARQLLPRGLFLPSGVAGAEEEFHRRLITREEVIRLGLSVSKQIEYDPVRIVRYRASAPEVIPWPEHPNGHWTRIINSDGAREDHELPVPPPDLFVLVAGDSHTEGVCDNAESYSNLLEGKLLKERPERSVEVYNTGVGGYSFYNYVGVLEDFLARKPDVFVTTIFGGNDFFEVLNVQHLFDGTIAPPLRSRSEWSHFLATETVAAGAIAQGLNQLLFLRDNPDQADLALKAALYATSEIQRLCKQNGVDWIAVYLPSAFDLPFPDIAKLRTHVKEALKIADADFEIGNNLANRMLQTLRERGVNVLDLRPIFGAETQSLYWSDLHINLHGHEVVANALLPRVDALIAERAARHAQGK
jgi:lysophospholipase L1-like esterase